MIFHSYHNWDKANTIFNLVVTARLTITNPLEFILMDFLDAAP